MLIWLNSGPKPKSALKTAAVLLVAISEEKSSDETGWKQAVAHPKAVRKPSITN
jgi:hypothetical protein